jgi:hypothetical protein
MPAVVFVWLEWESLLGLNHTRPFAHDTASRGIGDTGLLRGGEGFEGDGQHPHRIDPRYLRVKEATLSGEVYVCRARSFEEGW